MKEIAAKKLYHYDQELHEKLTRYAEAKFLQVCQNTPSMHALHFDDEFLPRAYYARHLLETILRIRLNNEVDAYCLYKISVGNDALAKTLAQYLAEEFSHDNLFLADLEKFGMSAAEVDEAEPFLSTKALIGYMHKEIDHKGPMATMVWNWIVEWYSDLYNGQIRNKALKFFGRQYVKGVSAHINTDLMEDHDGLMFTTVEMCIKQNGGNAQQAFQYVDDYMQLLGWYFSELHMWVQNPQNRFSEKEALLRQRQGISQA